MAEEYEEQIEAAEESEDTTKLLDIIADCSAHGGDEDWAEAAEGSLDALFRLAKSGTASSCADKALPVLFDSLKAWKDANDAEAIVEVALGCIVSLSKSYETTNDDVAGESTLDLSLLISILQKFTDESTVQEQACLAIEGLALVSDSCKERFKAMDGMQAELVAAKERIINERNKAYPSRAAEALGLIL